MNDDALRGRDGAPEAPGTTTENAPSNFIRSMILEDLQSGRYQRVVTRFPPEPNGYLHIGHAKSICLNFGLAAEFNGVCHLRMDDTNPETEKMEYVESFQRDIRWLGYDWKEHMYYASDYYEALYRYAEQLIRDGRAYVCDLTEEQVREYRGTVNEPGRESPGRRRSVEENLDLFQRMRAGEFAEGAYTLRAVGDMSAANMKMRDPLLYRIKHADHYRTGKAWHIYPMYDYAHPLSDAIEGITHSICTLEFENNRDIYDWVIENCRTEARPYQIEFARLKLNYTLVTKRRLLILVEEGHVRGWDDPRMPTVAAMRRRGYTPEAIRDFAERVGVARANSVVDIALLERCVRDDLHVRSPRVMAVLNPLKVVIENFPEGEVESLDCPYFPPDVPLEGSRKVPFSREIYIERDDFMEVPPKGYHRLSPGQEVRLRYAYFIRCTGVVKDENGEVIELRCSYDPATRGGSSGPSPRADGRKVKGTIHWVSAAHAVDAEVRLYDRLFLAEDPAAIEDWKATINPQSLVVVNGAKVEPSLASAAVGAPFQFERLGFFNVDLDSKPGKPVFNRTVTLKESFRVEGGVAKATSSPLPLKGTSPLPPAGEGGPTSRARRAGEGGRKVEEAGAREKIDDSAPPSSGLRPPSPASGRRQDTTRPADQEARIARYRDQLGLPADDAEILVDKPALGAMFDEAVALHDNPKALSNWLIHELQRDLKERPIEGLPFGGAQLAGLVRLIDDGTISTAGGKAVLAELLKTGGDPAEVVERLGLRQVADVSALEPIVAQVIAQNPENVVRYREGRTNLLGFFVGQVMKATRGTANPQLVNTLVRQKLDG